MDAKRLSRLVAYAATVLIGGAMMTASPGSARAQDRTKASFRFEEGKQALARGRFAEAVAALGEAHTVLKTPASALAYAQALEKTSRLAEALVVANDGKSFAKGLKETFTMMKARADLDALALALDKRVPRVRLGGGDTGAGLKIDGKEVVVEAGIMRLDPGTHVIESTRPGGVTTTEVTLAEGEEKSLVSTTAPLVGVETASDPPERKDPLGSSEAKGAAPTRGSAPARAAEPSGPSGAAVAAIAGFTGFAFGAGLGIGGFLVSRARLDELEASCPEGECAPYSAGEYRDVSATRIVAFAAFGVAGAGLVTGIVGAVVAGQNGSTKTASASTIRVSVGATSVSVHGSF